MNALQQLANQVLLGTERRPPDLAQITGPIGDLAVAASTPDTPVEVQVLRRAGIYAVCGRAGHVPMRTGDSLPPRCADESAARLDDPDWRAALSAVLGEGPDLLRAEALRRLAEHGAVLPPSLLPAALALAQKTPALRQAVAASLGERGQWLARQNPDWQIALAAAAAPELELWDHGSLEQRKALLAQLRAVAPDAARERLAAGFGEFDARERAQLLETLSLALGPGDEVFLESLLADRSKEVRQLAASLLAALPASRYVMRMASRLGACLSTQRKLFRTVWQLDPPEAFGDDWKADAMDATRAKSETLGERAWWLYQLVRAVPLAFWVSHTGLSAAELVQWAKASDWAEAVLRGWGEALTREAPPEWIEALLATADAPMLSALRTDWITLIEYLPAARREAHWRPLVQNRQRALGDLLGRINQSAAPCSAAFARLVLKEVRDLLVSDAGKWDYALRKTLPEFICLIPLECLDEAGQHWPLDKPDTQYFSETLARVLAIAALRKTLNRPLSLRKST